LVRLALAGEDMQWDRIQPEVDLPSIGDRVYLFARGLGRRPRYHMKHGKQSSAKYFGVNGCPVGYQSIDRNCWPKGSKPQLEGK
jgi:hypothetical protein